jgi:hypothetical protein
VRNDHGLANAVRSRFPDAELYLCEWHLRHSLERLMGKLHAEDAYREAIEELFPEVEAAFTAPSFWAAFLKRAHAVGIPRVRVAEHHRGDRRGAVPPARTTLEVAR